LRSSPALRRVAWAAVAVGVVAPLVRHRLGLRPPVVSALTIQAPVALALATPRSRLRDAGIYTLQMWSYYAHYDMPDDQPERLEARTRVGYPVAIDRVIGAGELPTVRLQRALGRPGRLRPHDVALSCVHWTWFFVPHGTMAYLLWRHPGHYARSATLMAVAFDLGALVYWALPTAPPWWASKTGKAPPVRRIMEETGERIWGRLWRPLYDLVEGNPFAAMPSLHFGTSVMSALVLSGVGRRAGATGWAYALTLGFGLVYLGEHYVVDLAAGFALAVGVHRLAPHLGPAVARIGGAIQRLEPRVA